MMCVALVVATWRPIGQYVAPIMFALIRCLIGDAGEQARSAGRSGVQAERADKHDGGTITDLKDSAGDPSIGRLLGGAEEPVGTNGHRNV